MPTLTSKDLQRGLLLLYGAFWLGLGVLVAAGVLDLGLTRGARLLGLLLLANGLALGVAARLTPSGSPAIDLTAAGLVGLNAVLSLSDDIGPADLVSLAVCVGVLGLMWRNRGGAQGEEHVAEGSRRSWP